MARFITSFLFYWLVALSLISGGCQTRQESASRNAKTTEEVPETQPKSNQTTLPSAAPPPALAPKGWAQNLLRYAPGETETIILVHARKMFENPQVYSLAEAIFSSLKTTPNFLKLTGAGLDPLRSVEGLCIIFIPKTAGLPGSSWEVIWAITGDFDAARVAAAMTGVGGTAFEAPEANVLLIGSAPMLTEAKSAAKKSSPLADSPDLSAVFASLDTSRPLYGASFQPPARRTSTSPEDRYHQLTLWLDFVGGLELELDLSYDDATEAASAASSMEGKTRSMLASIEAMLKSMGLPGGISLLTYLGFRTSTNHVIISWRLDEAQMAGLFSAITKMLPMIFTSPAPPPPSLPSPYIPPKLPH